MARTQATRSGTVVVIAVSRMALLLSLPVLMYRLHQVIRKERERERNKVNSKNILSNCLWTFLLLVRKCEKMERKGNEWNDILSLIVNIDDGDDDGEIGVGFVVVQSREVDNREWENRWNRTANDLHALRWDALSVCCGGECDQFPIYLYK